MPVRRRDPFGDVGAATRHAITAAMPGLSLPEARVLLALVGSLTTWSKLSDRLAARQLADATGMDEREVRRAVAGLVERGVIEREQSSGRVASRYRWPTPPDAKPGAAAQGSTSPNPGDINPGDTDQGSEEPGSQGTANPGDTAHHPENYTEVITPLPPSGPAGGGCARHDRRHANCRDCGTSPRGQQPAPQPPPGPRPWAAAPEDSADVETRLHVVPPPPEIHGPPHPLTRHRLLQAGGAA